MIPPQVAAKASWWYNGSRDILSVGYRRHTSRQASARVVAPIAGRVAFAPKGVTNRMTRLAIHLLGPFAVTLDGNPVTHFDTNKTRALLAYLAAEPGYPCRREALAEMLWPDRPEGAGRANLRHTLRSLRLATGDYEADPPFLLGTMETISLNPEGDSWVDVRAFAASLAEVQAVEGLKLAPLEQALGLYRGSFLQDFSLADSALFEEWLVLKREQFQRKALDLLSQLVAGFERRGEYNQALAHAWRQVELEPWDETAYQQLMRLLALSGHRAEALAQYGICRRVLAEELDVEPANETTQLYEQIKRRELGPELALEPAPPSPNWDLPASPTPFFGRLDELATLEAKLAEPNTRLVTLTGPGGSGKTRLALEAGARFAEQDRQALADGLPLAFPHGVVFVPLAAVPSVEGLMPALADALQLRLQGGQEQLVEALSRRQILLILDNLEHLLAGVELLAEILSATPGVRILATSRERLQLRTEHVFPVGGLSYPDHDLWASSPDATDLDACVTAYPAFQLLVESARRVQPQFALTPEDLPVLSEICRQVDGLPLALELAASWADALSLGDILAEARQSLGFLQAEWRDAPKRHRSMRAVFDVSWRRLSVTEQTVVLPAVRVPWRLLTRSRRSGGWSRGESPNTGGPRPQVVPAIRPAQGPIPGPRIASAVWGSSIGSGTRPGNQDLPTATAVTSVPGCNGWDRT